MRKRKIAFTCITCGEAIADPLYTGPLGHRRAGQCLDCHLGSLYGVRWRRRSARGIAPELVDIAWMLYQGHTQKEIAARVGLHRNTVAQRIERLKRRPALLARVLDLLGMTG